MQSGHFVVLLVTIQIQLNKDWISISVFFKHENTLKYLQKKYTHNAHHLVKIIWDWVEVVKSKCCVAEIAVQGNWINSKRKRGTEENYLNNTEQKSDNGHPKRIWL